MPPQPTASPCSPEHIRSLLHRKTLATQRHRLAVARQLGLGESELAALAHFAHHGQLSPGQLADLLLLTSGGVTALIQRLESAGHLRRGRHPTDRRRVLLAASPEILAAASEAFAPLVSQIDGTTRQLPEPTRDAIGRYLEQIVTISEHEAERANHGTQEEPTSDEPYGIPEPALWT